MSKFVFINGILVGAASVILFQTLWLNNASIIQFTYEYSFSSPRQLVSEQLIYKEPGVEKNGKGISLNQALMRTINRDQNAAFIF